MYFIDIVLDLLFCIVLYCFIVLMFFCFFCFFIFSFVVVYRGVPVRAPTGLLRFNQVEHFGIVLAPWNYKLIHSTYGSSWHVDSFYWIYLPCPLQNIMFNVWISMASWLMIKCSLPSPTTNTLNTWKKGILSHFWNLQSLGPTKQYVEKKVKVDTSSFFLRWKLTRRVILKI